MSKDNKVNPGQYTQAGRLTADETAREMKKQREVSSPGPIDGTPHPFQATKQRDRAADELDDEREVSPDETATDATEPDEDK